MILERVGFLRPARVGAGVSRWPTIGLAILPVFAALPGCVGAGSEASGVDAFGGDESLGAIRGVVVDAEIVPVKAADVELVGHGKVATTDAGGAFSFSALEPGTYTLVASKAGYAGAESAVAVAAGQVAAVSLALTPVALNVPYHETILIVALLDCSWAITSATFPCVPIDRVTGQNITGDRSAWKFSIPAAGLANLLHEMEWSPQPIGREMKVVITEPNQPVFIGGVTRFYLVNQGPTPLRAWLEHGKVAVGGSVAFDGNESTRYDAYIRGSPSNNTIPQAALYIDQRANNWFTFFYNRPGNPDFTALPDR